MTIEIINMRNQKPTMPYDVRIDRASPLGNPYAMATESRRDEVCDMYANLVYKITKNPGILNKERIRRFKAALNDLLVIYKEHGKLRLFCWCAPKRCHAETIKEWLGENV